MAAPGFVGPPSVDGISHKADEVVNGKTWTAAEPRKDSTAHMTKLPSDVKEAATREALDMKKEMNGRSPPDRQFPNKETVALAATVAGAATVARSATVIRAATVARAVTISPAATVAHAASVIHDARLAVWESLAKKAVILGNASVTKMEALPGDIKGVEFVVCFRDGGFKEHDLKPVFDNQNCKLVIELDTTDEERELVLEKLGMEKIAKEVGEFPADVKVNASGISWTWREEDHGVLTVLVPIDHQEAEKKTGAVNKFLGFVKGALAKAVPACICVAAKEFVEEMNGDTEE